VHGAGKVAIVVLAAGCSSDPARTAAIWSNGNVGCWGDPGDDCATGGNRGKIVGGFSGLSGTPVAIADDITGGIPSLQLAAPAGAGFHTFCIGSGSFNMCEQRDLRAFAAGHLQFDARLESPLVTSIAIDLFPSLTVHVPIASLSTSKFLHQTIALTPDLFGTDGPPVSQVDVFKITVTASAPTPDPLLTVNAIKWTKD